MSRIDEALRRAAEMQTAGGRAPIGPVPVPLDEIAELAREAYQAEEPAPDIEDTIAVSPFAPAERGSVTVMPEAIEAADANSAVLGSGTPFSFERIDARYAGKTVVDQDISPQSREQYRRLAATLHHAKEATGLTIVMITSAVSGEGKTLTSSNLALTLSESYKKTVLLIDTDLRKPSLHSVFRVKSASGLSEGLASGSERTVPIYQVSARLAILSAGRPTSDPIAHLTSPRMRRLLDEARNTFDWIILDTPPVALLPDANLLSTIVDGAVLVVKASSTPHPLVERALEAIGRDKTLGVVLNRTTSLRGSDYYGYYGYGYAYGARPAAALPATATDADPPSA